MDTPDLRTEIDSLKAENAAVRELLRTMQEQQKMLLEQVDRLQRRLDGGTPAASTPSGSVEAAAPQPAAAAPERHDHYQDGIVIWQNAEGARVPFLLKFNNNTPGQFVVPKTLVVYGRGSKVFGQFANPYESAGGAKWYFLPTERVWLTAELMRVHKAPYGGAFTPYTAGLAGWVPMIQAILAF